MRKEACYISHVQKTAHLVVKQDIQNLNLDHAPVVRSNCVSFVSFGDGILVLWLDLEYSNLCTWLKGQRINVGLPLLLLVSNQDLDHTDAL